VRVGKVLFAGIFIVGGVGHFVFTRIYASIVPEYLPAPRELVLISGAAEIAGGVGVLIPQTRRLAAFGLAILLISITPANIFMAQHPDRFGRPRWLLWARVPLQIPLIYWASLYTRKQLQ
jgi:uncharacterized membrane protein